MSLEEYIELSLIKESVTIKSLDNLNQKLRPENHIIQLKYLPQEGQEVINYITNLAKPLINTYFQQITKAITGEICLNELNETINETCNNQLSIIESLKTKNRQERKFKNNIKEYLINVRKELINNGLKHYNNIISELRTLDARINELMIDYSMISNSLINLNDEEVSNRITSLIYGQPRESRIINWIKKHKGLILGGLTGLIILSQATRMASALENNAKKAYFVEGYNTDDIEGDDSWKVWEGTYDFDDETCNKEKLIYTVHGKNWNGNTFLGYSCDMGTPNDHNDDCWIDFTPRQGGYDAVAYNIGGEGEHYNFKIEGGINQETVITSMHPQAKAMSPLPFNTPIGDRIGETNCDLAFKAYDEEINPFNDLSLLKSLPVFLLGMGSGALIGALITRKVMNKPKKTIKINEHQDEIEFDSFLDA